MTLEKLQKIKKHLDVFNPKSLYKTDEAQLREIILCQKTIMHSLLNECIGRRVDI